VRNWVSPFIKLVIFLVITSFATYVLGATISNSAYGSTSTYHANFSDVTGLQIGDDVRIAGVRVGTVGNIQIKQNAQHVGYGYVTFSVEKASALPKLSEVFLRYRNLIGQRYLDVEQGAGNPNDVLAPGSTIPLARTHPAVDLTVLFNGFGPLTQGLDAPEINQLSYNVIQTLQGEGGAFESLLGTIADLTNTLADKDKVIGQVIDNLSGVLTAVGQRDTQLNNLVVELKDFFVGLSQDRNTIGNAIDGINKLTTNTANLLTQARAPLARDIKDITGLVGVLNNNSGTLQFVINELPATIGPLVRTASYGSWFNFYLCSTSGTITLPGNKVMNIPLKPASKARCTSP
jgi:phospholipid/cholesterol/gamma-HCH transport system substrate-binding protein